LLYNLFDVKRQWNWRKKTMPIGGIKPFNATGNCQGGSCKPAQTLQKSGGNCPGGSCNKTKPSDEAFPQFSCSGGSCNNTAPAAQQAGGAGGLDIQSIIQMIMELIGGASGGGDTGQDPQPALGGQTEDKGSGVLDKILGTIAGVTDIFGKLGDLGGLFSKL
jgi:hypothetical protein